MTNYAHMLEDALKKRGLRVLREVHDKLGDDRIRIDLALPDARINIEIDGRHHLRTAEQILTDIERTRHSFENGYATIHVTNHDVYKDVEAVADAFAEAAKIRMAQEDK